MKKPRSRQRAEATVRAQRLDHLREASITRWVDRTMGDLRPRGTDAATTCAILGLVQGAAQRAISRADGSIDEGNAQAILDHACRIVRAHDGA